MKSKKNVHFVSELDKFSEAFNRTHPLSDSQQAEIKKYQHIYQLRDVPQTKNKQNGSDDKS